jgi:hypothetical protein
MNMKVTDKQRRALQHIEQARSEGMALSDYARAHGVSAREIYDAMAALRRKGVLPPAKPSSQSAFVALRVKPAAPAATLPTTPSGALICRLRLGAAVIECAQWPPAAWVTALATGCADATA